MLCEFHHVTRGLDVAQLANAHGTNATNSDSVMRSSCKLLDISKDVIKAKTELFSEIKKKKEKNWGIQAVEMSVGKTSALLKLELGNQSFGVPLFQALGCIFISGSRTSTNAPLPRGN